MTLNKNILVAIFLLIGAQAFAFGGYRSSPMADSLLPIGAMHLQNYDLTSDLSEAETEFTRTKDDQKAVRLLVRALKIKRLIPDSRRGYKLFSNLARFSASLKLYPLAMKFYGKAEQYRRNTLLSWYQSPLFTDPVHALMDDDPGTSLLDSVGSTYLDNMDSVLSRSAGVEAPSTPVNVRDLQQSFDDGKTAISFALIVHVKQPVPGKRKCFTHINNVGHMFITLIKYNADSSFITRSFGFYPHKKGLFSATPLHVRSPSFIKDDAFHAWDEAVGKFISPQQFRNVLGLLSKYDRAIYNLNKNNCTDFGLGVAAAAGISISDTRGRWPLGHGNNPGNAGQSMLQGKFRNEDPGYRDPLFVSNNVNVR